VCCAPPPGAPFRSPKTPPHKPLPKPPRRYGKVVRPALGITIGPDQLLRRLGRAGVLVLDTQPGGGAEAAGLRPTSRDAFGRMQLGDVIVSLDGAEVKTYEDLFDALDAKRVGDTVRVGVERGAARVELPLRLGERTPGQAE
jgi:S1-C subfamily serine protease